MPPCFYVELALDPGIKMPGDIPRLLPEGSPRLLEVPLFEGTDIFIPEATCRVYVRRLARLTVSLKTKMPGEIPRPLTALHKGTQPIYTMASVRMADSIESLFL